MPGHSSGEEEIPQEEQQGALVGTELEGVYDTEIMIEVIYVYIYIYIYIRPLQFWGLFPVEFKGKPTETRAG